MSAWRVVRESDGRAHEIFSRHYSCRRAATPAARYARFGPGRKIVLLARDNSALFVWLYQTHGHVLGRPYCMAFRNEGAALSSDLILAAEPFLFEAGWDTSQPAITFVNPRALRGGRGGGDGLCFKRAGWTKQKSKSQERGLIVLTKKINLPAGA